MNERFVDEEIQTLPLGPNENGGKEVSRDGERWEEFKVKCCVFRSIGNNFSNYKN